MRFDGVRKIALAIDGVEESTSYGTPAFKIRGKLIARIWEDLETLVVRTTVEEREVLMASDPERYLITEHYLKYPWVLVRLPKADSAALHDLLRAAAKHTGPAKKR